MPETSKNCVANFHQGHWWVSPGSPSTGILSNSANRMLGIANVSTWWEYPRILACWLSPSITIFHNVPIIYYLLVHLIVDIGAGAFHVNFFLFLLKSISICIFAYLFSESRIFAGIFLLNVIINWLQLLMFQLLSFL